MEICAKNVEMNMTKCCKICGFAISTKLLRREISGDGLFLSSVAETN